jgi:hypothetical protein
MSTNTQVLEHRREKQRQLKQRIEHEALAEHLQERVRQPDPILGWEGNPYFTIVRHRLLDRIEIWYDKPGEEQMVAHAPCDPAPDIGKLLVGLMEWGDEARRPIERRIEAMDKHNDAIMADKQRVHDDQMEEAADVMELAVVKDIQGFRGRFY